MVSLLATIYVRGPVEQWSTILTMNQKIAGSSPARIDRVLCDKDLDRLVGALVRNVIHYVPVLLPNHHL
jgi:hypothetical protein